MIIIYNIHIIFVRINLYIIIFIIYIMDELNLYNIECNNIQDILNRKKNVSKEVASNNDEKYRELRKTIMLLRKENSELKSQLKILKELSKSSSD